MQPVPERLAARAAGEKFYFVSKPCKNGHICKRKVSTGKCVMCNADIRRRYMASHPGLEAGWARERRAKDPTGHRAEVKRWKEKNPEYGPASVQRWKDRHPELARKRAIAYVEAYRARRQAAGGSFTVDDIERMFERQRGRCANPTCRCKLTSFEIDHIVPVIRGGHSDPSNLQLLCRPCNRSKGGSDPIDWMQSRGLLL